MADALSLWTRIVNPDTGEVDFSAEASELGMKPGQRPGNRSLPEGHFALSYTWNEITSNGELVGWETTLQNGTTYTIFND
jgi:hypothetical protein